MNEKSEFASKFVDSCIKALLSALAFSALAYGLAEKYRELYRFRALGQYTFGRELLDTALFQLKGDPCWEAYVSVTGDSERVASTNLSDIERISCDYSSPMSVRMNDKDLNGKESLTVPPKSENGVGQKPPALPSVQVGKEGRAVPSAPTNIRVQLFYNLSADTFHTAVRILWDDETLKIARTYSNAAEQEVFRWQTRRTSVSQKRGATGRGQSAAAPPPTMVALVTNNLTISDLEYLNSLPRSTLEDFDRSMRENFRAAIPNSSLGVTMGTATFAVAFAISFFMIAVAAYITALKKYQGFTAPDTILHVIIGSIAYEVAMLLVLLVPSGALYNLIWDLARTLPPEESPWAFWPLHFSAAVTTLATLYALWTVAPLLQVTQPLMWARTRLRRFRRRVSDGYTSGSEPQTSLSATSPDNRPREKVSQIPVPSNDTAS